MVVFGQGEVLPFGKMEREVSYMLLPLETDSMPGFMGRDDPFCSWTTSDFNFLLNTFLHFPVIIIFYIQEVLLLQSWKVSKVIENIIDRCYLSVLLTEYVAYMCVFEWMYIQ